MVNNTTIKEQIIKTPLEGTEEFPIYDPTGNTDRKTTTDDVVARVDAVLVPVKDVNGETGPSVTLDTDKVDEGSTNLYDKVVALTAGTNIAITGTYPNFTISNTFTGTLKQGDIYGGVGSNITPTKLNPDMVTDITPSGTCTTNFSSGDAYLTFDGSLSTRIDNDFQAFSGAKQVKYEFDALEYIPIGSYVCRFKADKQSNVSVSSSDIIITYDDDTTLNIGSPVVEDTAGTLYFDFTATKPIKAIQYDITASSPASFVFLYVRDISILDYNPENTINISLSDSRAADNTKNLDVDSDNVIITNDNNWLIGIAPVSLASIFISCIARDDNTYKLVTGLDAVYDLEESGGNYTITRTSGTYDLTIADEGFVFEIANNKIIKIDSVNSVTEADVSIMYAREINYPYTMSNPIRHDGRRTATFKTDSNGAIETIDSVEDTSGSVTNYFPAITEETTLTDVSNFTFSSVPLNMFAICYCIVSNIHSDFGSSYGYIQDRFGNRVSATGGDLGNLNFTGNTGEVFNDGNCNMFKQQATWIDLFQLDATGYRDERKS